MARPDAKFQGKIKAGEKGEFKSYRQDIEGRLFKIMASDAEGGQEKVSLFSARCGLRLFPLAVSGILNRSENLNKYGKIEWLGIIWRALIVAWAYKRKLAADTAAAAYAANAAADAATAAAYAADAADADAAAAADATTYAAYAVAAADADAAYAVADADAYDVAAAAAAAVDAAADADADVDADADGANSFDLQKLESPDFTILDLRRIPLWPDAKVPEYISDTHWQTAIADWVAEHSNDEDNSEVLILSKISRDYEAILKGVWIDDDKLIADEKPQQDLPSAIDYLGRDQLVNALAPRMSVKNDQNHLTIGLLGNWGIGKSSVIKQLRDKLNEVKHCDYVFGEFNAWSYEHTPNLQAGIAHEVISALTTAQPCNIKPPEKALPPEKQWPWYRRWSYKPYVIWKFAIRLHGKRILVILLSIFIAQVSGFFQLLGSFMSSNPVVAGAGSLVVAFFGYKELKTIISQPLAKELKTYLQLPNYQEHLGTIPEMGKNIKALCKICLGEKVWDNNRRLVFFVDDLDRCGVDGIVKTFEAVRLVLDIPWVTVVIAMDHRIALPALACHYEKLSKFHQRDPLSIARAYLAKVVHLPIRLQVPDNQSVARYLAHIWDDTEFVKKIFAEQSPEQSVSPQPDIKSKQPDEAETPADKPEESLQDIISDINSVDVKSVLKAEQESDDAEQAAVKESQGFGQDQKEKFYQWLINFNLRNPRQIKRLYNCYNLLWSIYDVEWKEDKDDWYNHMLALLVLEMINEHVPFDVNVDTRGQYRQAFFNLSGDKKVLSIERVDSTYINEAHKLLLTYQKDRKIDLLKRLKPFVLPAIRPQDINKT